MIAWGTEDEQHRREVEEALRREVLRECTLSELLGWAMLGVVVAGLLFSLWQILWWPGLGVGAALAALVTGGLRLLRG